MASFLAPSLTPFPSPYRYHSSPTKYRIKVSKFTLKSHRSLSRVRGFTRDLSVFSIHEAPRCSKNSQEAVQEPQEQERQAFRSPEYLSKPEKNVIQCVTRHIGYALICIAIGGFYPAAALPAHAFVAELVASEDDMEEEELSEESDAKRREHSDYTKCLLEEVSVLLRRVEEVRRGNGQVEGVEVALKAVKAKKEELEREIMEGMYEDVIKLKSERNSLKEYADKIVHDADRVRSEYESSGKKGEKESLEKLEERVKVMNVEYDGNWERIREIDDDILTREIMAMSTGVRELCFIERESEELVKRFNQEMRQKHVDSNQTSTCTKLSRLEIQKELEAARRKLLEQIVLPNTMEVEDLGYLFDEDLMSFAQNIKQRLKDSRKLQMDIESSIRRKMKRFGDEKRLVVRTPEDEFLKGFPNIELKWMFGVKEVVFPKAIRLHLYHGWKKWREKAKEGIKRNLLEDVELTKQYVAQRQACILVDRDRVASKTWYNEKRSQWEMDPVAVPYAVSKKLVDHAWIRHDWGAMYISLKGDYQEYYVDIKEFETLYEDFEGFDGLYSKMLANGIPTSVQLMRIPFSELDLRQQFLLSIRFARLCFNEVWNGGLVSYWREWTSEKISDINNDLTVVVLEFIVPVLARLCWGMKWREKIKQTASLTWFSKWYSEAKMRLKFSKSGHGTQWFLSFVIRTVIYGYIVFHMFQFLKRKVPRLHGYGPLVRDPSLLKLQRVKAFLKFLVRVDKRKRGSSDDPLKVAFDGMKRVKNPPIPLKDFVSLEYMREEINEVVAFLQNPSAFQEIGARAPRGVLIVGEAGTGKTSLALAIAAEARVPIVKVEARLLEPGRWVGQSASNVRELFQAARDLAPVILFVEEFDRFAGVRGKYVHTKNQDHESFINQLLVELDGFENQEGVVLMATTRNIKKIDKALQRPGRMDRVFYLQRLSQTEREKILHVAAKETMDEEVIDFVDWRKVAEKTSLLLPTDLKAVPVALEGSAFRNKFFDTDELMSYCSWFATFSGFVPKWVQKTKIAKNMNRMLINHLGLSITKEDMQKTVDLMEPYGQISNGIELLSPPVDWTRETKLPHAVWTAGRGLIAFLLPNFHVVDNLWLEPLSWQGIGCSKITKARNEGLLTVDSRSRSYLEKKLVFCFGSYVASQLLLPFGEENFLSSSELKEAQEIATEMVTGYGWGSDDSPAIYCTNGSAKCLSMGNNYAHEMAAKVEKMYDLAYLKAKEMLLKNRRVLEKIVEELLEFEVLSGKDLERIVADNDGVREKEPFFLSKGNYRESHEVSQMGPTSAT
nr:AAA-type ATPase family protein [Passiflora pittieri]